MEEKIKIEEKKPARSPALAGILSLFPGAGAIYNGSYLKGIVMMIIFAGLISIQGRGGQPFVALLLAGFYIFQIIDAVNEAKCTELTPETAGITEASKVKLSYEAEISHISKPGSVSWGIILILLGGLFLLANFDLIDYESFIDFWPLILVGLGLKLIIDHFSAKKS
ncbi:MAG: DUF5668 domain-containing protein [Acidobacteriota bacterium]|nr:DUF5668 domain-containing protein [Acidobacteriota bacterium]